MTCISLTCSSLESSSGYQMFPATATEEEEEEDCCSYLDGFDSLEKVLPIRKGISKFYCGKSKSFTNLSDSSCCLSMKDIGKPDDSWTRKRKNLLA